MAQRARQEVASNWDAAVITDRLVEKYRELLGAKRVTALPALSPVSSQSAPLHD
jgi:hypothetical protein